MSLPAGGFGVQLPKTMALRVAATGQIGADINDEEAQQYERAYGARPCGGGRYQDRATTACSANGSNTPSGAAKDA